MSVFGVMYNIKWGTSVKTYTLSKRLHERTPPPPTAVPLVLSGPLCPAGISPPRGESPLSGEAYNRAPLKRELAAAG